MFSALKCVLPHIFCHFVTRHASFVISSPVYYTCSFISSPVTSLVTRHFVTSFITRHSSVTSHAPLESYKKGESARSWRYTLCCEHRHGQLGGLYTSPVYGQGWGLAGCMCALFDCGVFTATFRPILLTAFFCVIL